MQQKRKEIQALLALTVSILVLSSLVSFHTTDFTFFNAAGGHRPPDNWIGLLGANLAWSLFFLFGIGAYGLPLLGFWVSYKFFRRSQPFPHGWAQYPGILLLLLSFIGLASLIRPEIHLFGQKMLSGGQIGLILAHFLENRINPFGTGVLLVGLLLAALILSTPFSLKICWLGFIQTVAATIGLLRSGALKVISSLRRTPSKKAPNNARKSKNAALIHSGLPGSEEPSKKPPKPVRRGRAGTGSSLDSVVGTEVYHLPELGLLDQYEVRQDGPDSKLLEKNARILEQKLADFGVHGEVIGIQPGPVITMYEYAPAPGIKISRIVSLADDLSMALRAASIRVVAPIPGKAAIGIELPNKNRELVPARSVFESDVFRGSSDALTIALGKGITGQAMVTNLAKMPHLLIAGATGTGKSVCINAVLGSLLFRNTPEGLRLLLIDPKRIELSSYEGIPHLLHPVVTDAKMATRALRWAVQEMELRYQLIADKNARNIESYNRVILQELAKSDENPPEAREQPSLPHHYLPLIVIVIDELADLMMVASRDVEECIIRLAQMARAAGIHLILATQRPSVDVLTGIIKANISTRISFQVSSRVDSRTILDTAGAERLLGAGDMLFLPPGTAKLQRIHGAFISEKEVQRVTDHWRTQEMAIDPLAKRVDFEDTETGAAISDEDLDEKYDEAVELVVKTRQASISMLQRRLRVGYNRAARMIEVMEQQGLVGPSDGSKPREILLPARQS